MTFLADSNILLRLSEPGSPMYSQAQDALTVLKSRGEQIYVFPQNLVEYWAVATRPLGKNGLGFDPNQADQELKQIEGLFTLLADKPEIHLAWRGLVVSAAVSGAEVHDARIASAMVVHGITHILTFNPDDFKRFPVTAVHPSDVHS